jgi:nucleotide-binding universal stress UspA family protein
MPTTDELELAFPDINAQVSGGEPSFRRILVPVRAPGEAAGALAVAARVCSAINGVLRLVHVRIYDPPLRGAGRFYPETAGEAVLDEALLTLWASGLRAATAVVNAPRGQVAAAIARQASAWPADVIVLTRRPRPAISRLVLGSVSDQVMRTASCPVLAVHPRPEPSRGRFSRHASH